MEIHTFTKMGEMLPTLTSARIITSHRKAMTVDGNITIGGWQHESCWVEDIFSYSSIWANSIWMHPVFHDSDCNHIKRPSTVTIAQLHRSQPAATIAQLIAIRQSSYYKTKSLSASAPDCTARSQYVSAPFCRGLALRGLFYCPKL